MRIYIAYFSRILSMILSIVITKLFIESLSIDEFGSLSLWLSFSPWLSLFNLGLPVIFQNRISLHKSQNRNSDVIIQHSHDFSKLVFILILALSLVVLFFSSSNSTAVVLMIVVSLILNSMIQVYSSIMYGFLLNDLPNHIPLIVNVIIISSFFLLRSFVSVQLSIGLSYLLSSFIVLIISILFVPRIDKFNLYIDLSFLRIYSKEIISMCKVIILSNIVTALDFYFISRFDNSLSLFNYSFLTKIFLLAITFQSVLMANYWTRFSDFYYNKRKEKFIHLLKSILILSIGFTFFLLVLFFIFQDFIYHFLGSGKTIFIDNRFVFLVFFIYLIKVFSNVFASVLQSIGKFDNMFNYVLAQAIMAFVLQLSLGWFYGVYGVLIGILLSYLFTAAWYLPRKVFGNL